MGLTGYILGWIFSGLFWVRFFALIYFQQHGPVRFGFVFSTGAILKDFSGSFFGLFRFVFCADRLLSTTSPVRF